MVGYELVALWFSIPRHVQFYIIWFSISGGFRQLPRVSMITEMSSNIFGREEIQQLLWQPWRNIVCFPNDIVQDTRPLPHVSQSPRSGPKSHLV